jgi:Kef-type K+ transport system membrane component KefB
MELIVLTILLDRGIIGTNVFSALVLMAVVTTMLAMPLTRLALRWSAPDSAASGAERAITPEAVHPGAD